MNEFKELIESASIKEEKLISEQEMSISSFVSTVEEAFKKHFPNGYININVDKEEEFIACSIGMIGNVKDNANGYYENDKMGHKFLMHKLNDQEWSFMGSGKIYIKPVQGSYNVMDSIKTAIGNVSKINLPKAVVKLEKFFKKLSDLMKENKDKIYGVEAIDKKYMEFR